MKTVGIIGRNYINKDNQKIIQITEDIINIISKYPVSIVILLDEKSIDKCDGIIMPGGTTFNKYEEYILDYMIKEDKPVLGICLGMQIMASYDSKKRTKHDMSKKISNHYNNPKKYSHIVKIEKQTLLYKIINKKLIKTDSHHNNQINENLKHFIVNARSLDNVVEGIEYPNKKCILGLQWHPEYIWDNNSKKIFDYFINKL